MMSLKIMMSKTRCFPWLLLMVIALGFFATPSWADSAFQGPTAMKIVCVITHNDSDIEMLSVTGQQLNPQHGLLAMTRERYGESGYQVEQGVKNLRDYLTFSRGLEALGLWNGGMEANADQTTKGPSQSHAFLYAYKTDQKGKNEVVLHQPLPDSGLPNGHRSAFLPMIKFLEQQTQGGAVQERSIQQGTTLPTIVQLRQQLEAKGDESSLRALSQLEILVRKNMKM